MTSGFRALPRRRAVSAETAQGYREVPVATVSDSMSRLTAAGHRIRPRHDGTVMSGPAFTVRTRPGDNLMVHLALDLAEPGDVVVIDAGGDDTNAILGELMVIYARARKLGGLVVNGSIRDSAAIATQSLPVYSTGITHRGPYKDGPGEINTTVALAGMTVEPGDLVIGDADGVLCVPFVEAEGTLERARAKVVAEEATAVEFAELTADRTPIRARALALGLEFTED